MFHFSRRTLWIVIYITIPLIFLLNQLGPDPKDTPPATRAWSLDSIRFQEKDNLWSVRLPGAAELRLTIIQPMIPSESLPVAAPEAMRTSRQGGEFLVTVTNPARADMLEASIDFLIDWLPDADSRSVVVSGPLDDDLLAPVERLAEATFNGSGVSNEVAPRPALARLSSPPMGTDRQLAFLLWVGVLQQRLDGYDPQVQWDHRRRTSEVLFNQTLSAALFEPVTSSELAPVLEAYRASAAVRQRSAEQIHRYLVTSAVYDLPPDFLLNQERRLADISLADVNQQRERTLSEL